MKMNTCPAPLRILTLLAVACLPGALRAQSTSENDAYSAAVLADNPVVYYEFDGNLNDSSTNADNLVQNAGTTSFVAGPTGTGFVANMADAGTFGGNPDEQIANSAAGQENYVLSLQGTSSQTYSAWVNLSALPTATETVISDDINNPASTGLQLNLNPITVGGVAETQLQFEIRSADTDGSLRALNVTTTLALNTWINLVGTVSEATNTLTLYENGTQIGTLALSGTGTGTTNLFNSPTLQFDQTDSPGTTAGQFSVGSTGAGNQDVTTADVAEVSVFNTALSASQVDSLFLAAGVQAVPEPSIWSLMGLSGLALLFMEVRRRRQVAR